MKFSYPKIALAVGFVATILVYVTTTFVENPSPPPIEAFSHDSFLGTNRRLITIPPGSGGTGGGNEGRGIHYGPFDIGSKGKDGIFLSSQFRLHIYDDSTGTGGTPATELKTCDEGIDAVVGLSDNFDIYDGVIYTLERDAKQIRIYNYQTCSISKKINLRDTAGGSSFTPQGMTFVPNGSHPYGNRDSGGVFYWCSSSDGTVYVHDLPSTLADEAVVNAIDSFQPRGAVAGASGMNHFKELGFVAMSWGHASDIYFFQIDQQELTSSKFISLGHTSYPADQEDMQAIYFRLASAGAAGLFPINESLPASNVSLYTLSAEQGILASHDISLATIGVTSITNSGDVDNLQAKAFGSRWIQVVPYAGSAPVSFSVRSVDHLSEEGCKKYWLKTDYTLTRSWNDRGIQLPSAWTSDAASGGSATEFYFTGVQITPEKIFRIYTTNTTGGIAGTFSEVTMGKFCDTNNDGVLNALDQDCLRGEGGHANCNIYARDHVASSSDYCATPDAAYNASDEGVVCFDENTNEIGPYVFGASEFVDNDLNCTTDAFLHEWRVEIDDNGIDDDCNGTIDVDCASYAGDFSTADYSEYIACNSSLQTITWDTMDEEEGDLFWKYVDQYTVDGFPSVDCMASNECGQSCGDCPAGQVCIVQAGLCVDDPDGACSADCGFCESDIACQGGTNDDTVCTLDSECFGGGVCASTTGLKGSPCGSDADCNQGNGVGICSGGINDGDACAPHYVNNPAKAGADDFSHYLNECLRCVDGPNDGELCQTVKYNICRTCGPIAAGNQAGDVCINDLSCTGAELDTTCDLTGGCNDTGAVCIGAGACDPGDITCGQSTCGTICSPICESTEFCEFNSECKSNLSLSSSDCHDDCTAPPVYWKRCTTGCAALERTSPALKVGYTELTQKNIRAAAVAHGLYIDKQNLVNWNLSDLSDLSLGDLFDRNAIMDEVDSGATDIGTDFRHINVFTVQPYVDYQIMIDNDFLKTTQTGTLNALIDETAPYDHGIFSTSEWHRPVTAQEMFETIAADLGVKIARQGCHSMSRWYEAVCRSVNIPARPFVNPLNGFEHGFGSLAHRSVFFRDEGIFVRHGDDLHDYESVPYAMGTIKGMPISYYEANWDQSPCSDIVIPCLDPPCITNTGDIQADQNDLISCVTRRYQAVNISGVYPSDEDYADCSTHVCNEGYRGQKYCDINFGDDDCKNGTNDGTCEVHKTCDGSVDLELATRSCTSDSECSNINACQGGSIDGSACSVDEDCLGGTCETFSSSCIAPNCRNSILGSIGRSAIGNRLNSLSPKTLTLIQSITDAELNTLVNTFSNPPRP